MSWEAVGAVGTFAGAVAVIISLIYLAIQTRQNTRALRSASFHQVRQSFSDIPMVLAQDAELASIMTRVKTEPETLSPQEKYRYSMVLLTIMRRSESAYFQTVEGSLPKESWRSISETCKQALSDAIALDWWRKSNHRFDESFRKEIDGLIGK